MTGTVPRTSLQITDENREFWAAVERHELVAQRCNNCANIWYPPSRECPECLISDFVWAPLSGRGVVYSWVVFHRQFDPAYEPPYNVAVVELEEGIRMPTNIVGCELDEIRIGMPVEVTFEKMPDGVVLPRFRPAQ